MQEHWNNNYNRKLKSLRRKMRLNINYLIVNYVIRTIKSETLTKSVSADIIQKQHKIYQLHVADISSEVIRA